MNKDDIKNKIKKYVELYDNLLDFGTYAQTIGLFDYNGERQVKICCPFHTENTPSFSYSSSRGVWTCFGQCHTTGKVCKFHLLYLRKRNKNITILQTLKDLQKMFPTILPEIKLDFSSKKTVDNKDINSAYNEFIKNTEKIKIELKDNNNYGNKCSSNIDNISLDILDFFVNG